MVFTWFRHRFVARCGHVEMPDTSFCCGACLGRHSNSVLHPTPKVRQGATVHRQGKAVYRSSAGARINSVRRLQAAQDGIVTDIATGLQERASMFSAELGITRRVSYYLLSHQPALSQMPANVLKARIGELSASMFVTVDRAAYMLAKDISALERPLPQLRNACVAYSQALQTTLEHAGAVLAKQPMILSEWSPEVFSSQCFDLAQVLDMPTDGIAEALARLPPPELRRLMVATPEAVSGRVLQLQRCFSTSSVTKGALQVQASAPRTSSQRIVDFQLLLLRYPSLLLARPSKIRENLRKIQELLRIPFARVGKVVQADPPILGIPAEQLQATFTGLCAVLQLPEVDLAAAVLSNPRLLQLNPTVSRGKVDAIVNSLYVRRESITNIFARLPKLLFYNSETIVRRVEQLALFLAMSTEAVLGLVTISPSILCQSPTSVDAKIKGIGELLQMRRSRVVAMALRHPSLLSTSLETLQRNYRALGPLLNVRQERLAVMVFQQPVLLQLSAAYLETRLKDLAAVLMLPDAAVLSMLARNPGFVRVASSTWVENHDSLVKVLGIAQEVAASALRRAPLLLTKPAGELRSHCQRLRPLLESHPAWSAQLRAMLPDEVVQCAKYKEEQVQRLEHIVSSGLQDQYSFLDRNLMYVDFCATFPDYMPGRDHHAVRSKHTSGPEAPVQPRRRATDLSRRAQRPAVVAGEVAATQSQVATIPTAGSAAAPRKWIGKGFSNTDL